MVGVRINFSHHKLINILALSGVLFVTGCMQSTPSIVNNDQPPASVEPSQTIPAVNDYYYYLEGERVQLTPSLDWVVVKFASSVAAEQDEALKKYESFLGALDQVRDIPTPSVTLLPLRTGLTPEAFTELLKTMRNDTTSFSLANPLFHTDDSEIAVGDEFIAAFPAGKSLAEVNETNSMYGVELVEPILGQENTFVLRVTRNADLDALSMANMYQESNIAVYAAPNFIRIKL